MEGVPRAALLQPDQPPVGGWMLLGRIVFRDEQVELPGKGVYPLGEEPGVLVEGGGVQPMMVMSRSVSQVNSCWRDLRLGLAARFSMKRTRPVYRSSPHADQVDHPHRVGGLRPPARAVPTASSWARGFSGRPEMKRRGSSLTSDCSRHRLAFWPSGSRILQGLSAIVIRHSSPLDAKK